MVAITKIVEIKETIGDSTLLDNIYAINQLTSKLIRTLEFIDDINSNDFNYMTIVTERSKMALEKVYSLI